MKNSHNPFPNIKHRNLVYYVLYAGVLIGFAAFILHPDFRKIKQIEADTESVKKKIIEQNNFYMQYELYMDESAKLDKINYFNFAVKIGDKKCLLSEIQRDVENIGRQHGFALTFSRVREASDTTVLICSLVGEFHKLREFLIDLGKFSCLKRIEEIRIAPAANDGNAKQSGNSPEKEIVLTLCLLRPEL